MAAAPQPRLRRGELVTAAWGLALLAAMFAVKWYGVDNIPGRSPSVVTAVDAWNGLSVLRWLMLVAILLPLASVALHLSQGDHGSQTDTSLVVAVAATLLAAGLIYRVLIVLPESQAIVDQKLGALLGLGCGLAMAASAWQVRGVVRAAARAPVVAHRRPRRGAPAPAGAAPGGPARGAPAAPGAAAAPGGASAPGGPAPDGPAPDGPAPGGPAPAGAVGAAEAPGPVASPEPVAPAPSGPGEAAASEPTGSSDPVASEPVVPATEPAGVQTPADEPAPRRRRARPSRPRPT